jgi:hypothetical protein
MKLPIPNNSGFFLNIEVFINKQKILCQEL